MDTYKSTVRDQIQLWLGKLRAAGVFDWMVVVVGSPDAKKTNKLLPRSSVIDKMKTDFGGKQPDRCSVHEFFQ